MYSVSIIAAYRDVVFLCMNLCANCTLRLLLLAGTNFSVLVVCCIWQVLILAFLTISYVFLIDLQTN